MAEPVSTVDIEDVLASIRRLVIEEGGTTATLAPPVAPSAVPAAAPPAAPLVLTAEQRIAAPPGVAPRPVGAGGPAPARLPPLVLVSPLQAPVVEEAVLAPLAPEVPWVDPLADDPVADGPPSGPGDEAVSADAPPDDEDDEDGSLLPVPSPDLAPAPAVLDEGQLRDLVAEVVRAELEGPLGERITHNVRKLVRREILAILASRGL